MIIEINHPETYPNELHRIIENYLSLLPHEQYERLKQTEISCDSDVITALGEIIRPVVCSKLYEDVLNILEKYEMMCYHATKVFDKDSIIQNGLKLNTWEWYKDTFLNALMGIGFNASEINEIIEIVKREYDRKYWGRDEAICFFQDINDLEKLQGAGYDQFCESIGGEIARWALKKDTYMHIYNRLRTFGDAIIVKFKLPIIDIAFFRKDNVAFNFICFYVAKILWDYRLDIAFDGMTQMDVASDRIIELIPFDKEVDY